MTAISGATYGGDGAVIRATAIWVFWGKGENMASVAQRQMTARAYPSSEMPPPPGDEQLQVVQHWHVHRNVKLYSWEGSVFQAILRPLELHCNLLRINPTSFKELFTDNAVTE